MTMGLVHAARQIERHGRNGDKNLVHMSDSEIQTLDNMQGGPSFNPVTGLREYSFLSKLLPIVGGIGLNFLVPGLGTVIGAGLGSALGRGAQQLAEGKKFNLGQIAKSGVLGAGGAYLGQGLTGGGWSPTSPVAEVATAGGAAPKDVGFFKELAANLKPIAPQIGSALALSLDQETPSLTPITMPQTLPYDPNATPYWLRKPGQPVAATEPTDVDNQGMGGLNQQMYADGGDVAPAGMGLPQSAAMPQLMSAAQFGYLNARTGGMIAGPGDGKSDDIPAMLSNGEHVIDAATVSDLGNGDNDAGQKRLEEIKHKIRSSAGRKNPNKASPKQRSLGSLLNT